MKAIRPKKEKSVVFYTNNKQPKDEIKKTIQFKIE